VVIGGTSLAGGRFSIIGTLFGALTIQTLTTTILSLGIPPEISLVFKAVVVIVVCLLQSPKARTLLGQRRRRRAASGAAPPTDPPPSDPDERGGAQARPPIPAQRSTP
jgi:simple sugar transport system permease protein